MVPSGWLTVFMARPLITVARSKSSSMSPIPGPKTAPLDPGTYHYSFLVDGVLTPDPSNIRQRDWRNFIPWVSVLDVRGSDPFLYDPNPNVPHGKVHIETFVSTVLKGAVPLYVYTPPGYESSSRQYPVLFMLHGTGGTASQWSSDGRMEHLADNLIAAARH